MNKEKIYLIVGESGAGKSTIVNRICKNSSLKQLESYTTRKPRTPEEKGHVFISNGDFSKLTGLVAYTFYNGNSYGATREQVDNSNFYVIDPVGVKLLRKFYNGKRDLVVVYITASKTVRYDRMRERGDSMCDAVDRLKFDEKAFQEAPSIADYIITNNSDDVAEPTSELLNFIISNEKDKPNKYEKVVYFSHPYGGDQCNIEKASKILLELMENYPEYLFVSPIHAYQFAYNAVPYDTGLSYCLALLERSDECWVYGDWRDSVGCCAEIKYCQEHNIPLFIGASK